MTSRWSKKLDAGGPEHGTRHGGRAIRVRPSRAGHKVRPARGCPRTERVRCYGQVIEFAHATSLPASTCTPQPRGRRPCARAGTRHWCRVRRGRVRPGGGTAELLGFGRGDGRVGTRNFARIDNNPTRGQGRRADNGLREVARGGGEGRLHTARPRCRVRRAGRRARSRRPSRAPGRCTPCRLMSPCPCPSVARFDIIQYTLTT
jgi:hypothetical protein